jgi:hypothetical protein
MCTRKILFLFLLSVECISLNEQGFGQTNTAPLTVVNNFASMFPNAKNIEWRNKVSDYQVFFVTDNSKCEAKFSPGGQWISTEKQIKNDSIPVPIKDSIQSGKYADWNIQSIYILNFPDRPDQYHIIVTKNDMPNKILYFNKKGQMLRENLSL